MAHACLSPRGIIIFSGGYCRKEAPVFRKTFLLSCALFLSTTTASLAFAFPQEQKDQNQSQNQDQKDQTKDQGKKSKDLTEDDKFYHGKGINDLNAIGDRNVGCNRGLGNWYTLDSQVRMGQ